MITNRWIEKRKVYWDRMATLVGGVNSRGLRSRSGAELREMALLYRQIASDLSALRQEGTARTTEVHLNQLLARAHEIVYSGRKTRITDIWRFFSEEYPRIFRRLLPFTTASLAIFLGGALLGSLLTLARPEFERHLLGPYMIDTIERHEMWTHSVTSMAPQASSAIMTNNLGVTFATFAAGITAGLGTLYMIGWNGILLGVIGTACHKAQMSVQLWSFVAPHGSLELPAIVIAGGAGLRLAWGLLFPGIYRRGHSLSLGGAEAVRLIGGVIPMLIVAGILEGFFSPSAAPVWLKFVSSGVLFSGLLVWLFFGSNEGASPASHPGLRGTRIEDGLNGRVLAPHSKAFSLISR
jgi:uncharacterized membrane protein SpoIIM required for sporulation